jgi:hypothetical protein
MGTKLSERFLSDPAPLPLGGDELIEMTVPGSAPYTVVGTAQDIANLPPNAALPVANGGTGSTTASAARTALGLGTLATQSGTFSGTSSGTNTGDQSSVSGNAGTATALQTARTIGGVSFNGTANVSLIAASINGLQGTGLTANDVGFRQVPQNSQSAAYTTVAADSGKHILHPAADTTARTFTIDSNANVAYPIGTAITIVNENAAGVVTIAITSDTMRLAGAGTTGSRTLAANGIATALKITSTSWLISGTGLT